MKKPVNKKEFLLQLKVMVVAAIVIFMLALFTSCSIQKRPQIQITHVLAVTHEGDTLKLPIDVIRPVNYKIINYSSGYGYSSWYRPYYHNYNYNYNSYSGSTRSSDGNTNNNNNNNNNKIVPREDPGNGRPSGEVLLKGGK